MLSELEMGVLKHGRGWRKKGVKGVTEMGLHGCSAPPPLAREADGRRGGPDFVCPLLLATQ